MRKTISVFIHKREAPLSPLITRNEALPFQRLLLSELCRENVNASEARVSQTGVDVCTLTSLNLKTFAQTINSHINSQSEHQQI